MAKSLRIPCVIDLLHTDQPDEIRLLAADDRVDRQFDHAGPLLNRFIAGRLRRILQIDGVPLPSVAPREEPGRALRQAYIEAGLEATPADLPCSPAHIDQLAEYVLGHWDQASLGPLAQEVVGRLFVADYQGDVDSWAAAQVIEAAPRSFNPLQQFWWFITGRVGRARRVLAERVAGDGAAVHATGIAIHSLVRAFERMRELAAQPELLRQLSPQTAVSRSLASPDKVLRQATAQGTTAVGSFRPGTLVLFSLEAARARSLRRDVAFMTEGWSRCPAHSWVPALLAAVWQRAAAQGRTGRESRL